MSQITGVNALAAAVMLFTVLKQVECDDPNDVAQNDQALARAEELCPGLRGLSEEYERKIVDLMIVDGLTGPAGE